MHLAPWAALNKLKAYHGNLDLEQTRDILKDKKPRSYIITNYNPYNKGKEFAITKCNDTPGIVTTMHQMSFNIPDHEKGQLHVFHPLKPETGEDDHANAACDFTKHFTYPVNRTEPHSLRALARAVLCDTKTYQEVENLAKKGEITQDCKDYIMENASPLQTTSQNLIFCDFY